MTTAPLRLGISRCLLGDEVRFDGGHKRDNFLTDVFGRYVEWVPVCPEVEAGLGTPREAMRLVGDPQNPRLVTIKSGTDHTRALETLTTNRIAQLMELDLSGYVFKKGSPSCGIERVRIYNENGTPNRNGVGLFARAFIEEFPLIPVEEEGRLCEPTLREILSSGSSVTAAGRILFRAESRCRPWCSSTQSTNIYYWPTALSNAWCSDGWSVKPISIIPRNSRTGMANCS